MNETDPDEDIQRAAREVGPLVSIIMATYNCATTLPEALESVAAQSYSHWELVVCDDASTDSTPGVLAGFSRRFPDRVIVLRNRSNQKLAASLNRCLEVAAGEYVARMDGDDLCAPDRLALQVAFLQEHRELDVVGSAIQRFDEGGLADVMTLEPRPDRWSLRKGVPFAHATVMVRKRAYDLLGGYTVARRTQRGQDLDLWFRFFAAGLAGANLPEALYYVREDLQAIRRRTFKVRFYGFLTTVYGYRLLNYPRPWYVLPVLELMKAVVPFRVVLAWRQLQARRNHNVSAKDQAARRV